MTDHYLRVKVDVLELLLPVKFYAHGMGGWNVEIILNEGTDGNGYYTSVYAAGATLAEAFKKAKLDACNELGIRTDGISRAIERLNESDS